MLRLTEDEINRFEIIRWSLSPIMCHGKNNNKYKSNWINSEKWTTDKDTILE